MQFSGASGLRCGRAVTSTETTSLARNLQRLHVPRPVSCKVARSSSSSSSNSDGQSKVDMPSMNGSKPHQSAPAVDTHDADNGIFRSTGLHRAPLSSGVKTATSRYDLPVPHVAVRNLLEHARFGHLCTMMCGMHHRRAGYPFGTLVDFATDGAGYPIFCLSPLAIHSRNLMEEPRTSLVVQMPGWTGLANARVTIFGDVYQLPADKQTAARDIFFAKHANERKERFISGNFVYFRMNKIVDIYFVGGFGTVQWIDPAEYLNCRPDDIVLDNVTKTLQMLNETYGAELKKLFSCSSRPVDELLFISIDAQGVDIRVRNGSEFMVERIAFGRKVRNAKEATEVVERLLAKSNGALPKK